MEVTRTAFIIPEPYQNKLFLTPDDIMQIMQIGESLCYKYLNNSPPFRVERVGSKIIIFSNSFWNWYNMR